MRRPVVPKTIRRSLGSFSRKKGANRVDHIAGIDYGFDYGLVAVFLVWLVLTIALVILLEFRSHAQELLPVVSPRSHLHTASVETCLTQKFSCSISGADAATVNRRGCVLIRAQGAHAPVRHLVEHLVPQADHTVFSFES